ncbi:M28 family metallopeptidase [Hymenobacter fodinae]|uniref:M28 family metallopeptidase n=1 Tax=Hymenobacter fodinae TaxID=2510796 RepID=UPI001AEBEB7F|nr:M28 family peptidase [Hymenobacter fodinae]
MTWVLSSRAVAQNMDRARETISALAGPAMHGRGYVNNGEHLAASYLRSRFAEIGLLPLTPEYTQSFTLPINTFPGRAKLRVDGKLLRPGVDFIAEPSSGPGFLTGHVYQLDTLVFHQEGAQQRLLSIDLRHRVLVLQQPEVARLAQLPAALQAHLRTAAARVTLVPTKLTASLASEQQSQPQVQVLAQRWPEQARRITLRLDAVLQPAYQTQNLVGLLPGRVQPDSFLVVSAHYDHLGRLGQRTYFPGANDNASGTAMLLELAAYYARPENCPAYSLVFIAFGAEEAGLVGSRYFVDHPLVPLSHIRFLVNLDLLGTGEEGATVVNGRIFTQQYQLLTNLNSAGHYLPALAARGRAANSDHYYFSERGVPAFFLYTRGGPTAYHDVHDQATTLPLTGFRGAFGLLRDFLNRLGANSE